MKKRKIRFQIFFLFITGASALILFLQGFSEEKRLDSINESFTELYHDRLLAEHAVFRMNDLIHQKKSIQKPSVPEQKKLTEELLQCFGTFTNTKLTPAEKVISREMKGLMQGIRTAEHKGSHLSNTVAYDRLLLMLGKLSEIQVQEGYRLKDAGHQTVSTSLVGVKLHAAINIVLILSLLMLFKNTGFAARLKQQHELN